MRDALYHFAFSIPPSFCLTAKCHRLAEAEGRLGSYRNPQNLLRAFRGTLFPVHRTVIHSLAAASLPTGEGFWLCFIPLRHTSCATSPGGRGLSSADSLHGGALGYTSITLFKADLCCKKARTQKTPFKLNGVFTVSYLIYLSILRYILIRGGFLQSHHRLQCGLHRRK